MSNRLRILVGLLVVAALGFVGWRTWSDQHAPATATGAGADTAQAGLRSVSLWFADAGGDSLVREVREVQEVEGVHARVAQLVEALVLGPAHGGIAVVPNGTTVLRAYLDDRGQLTLDLSRAFQQGFHGGSREEDLIVGSLVRTIGSNLPEVKRVLFVCSGAPIASLGGHLPLDRPIDPHEGF
jgi:hypothetical protein